MPFLAFEIKQAGRPLHIGGKQFSIGSITTRLRDGNASGTVLVTVPLTQTFEIEFDGDEYDEALADIAALGPDVVEIVEIVKEDREK